MSRLRTPITIENIRVGEPDTHMAKSSHTWGVREGNKVRGFVGDPGHYYAGKKGAGREVGKATARRSTGINADKRDPIDPSMPRLPPP